jgi:hypothetical protein
MFGLSSILGMGLEPLGADLTHHQFPDKKVGSQNSERKAFFGERFPTESIK